MRTILSARSSRRISEQYDYNPSRGTCHHLRIGRSIPHCWDEITVKELPGQKKRETPHLECGSVWTGLTSKDRFTLGLKTAYQSLPSFVYSGGTVRRLSS